MIYTDSEPDNFLTRFSNGEQIAFADSTSDKGGGNCGFRPHELLEAAVATCLNMSLRMSAQKHNIPLAGAAVSVSLNRNAPEGPTFVYRMTLRGSLSEDQKSRLLASAANCPVRNTLSRSLHFTPGD